MAGPSAPVVDTAQAFAEGRDAAERGRDRLTNPYIARCPGNHGGKHKRSLSGRCFLCGDWHSSARDRARKAWDQGWRAAAAEIRGPASGIKPPTVHFVDIDPRYGNGWAMCGHLVSEYQAYDQDAPGRNLITCRACVRAIEAEDRRRERVA